MKTKKKTPNPNKCGPGIGLDAAKVKSLMDKQGLSCAEVAERGGFHNSAVHRYYRGETRFVRKSTLIRLAAVLGTRPHSLESGELQVVGQSRQPAPPKAKPAPPKDDGLAILPKRSLERMWNCLLNHGGVEDLALEDQYAVLKAIKED